MKKSYAFLFCLFFISTGPVFSDAEISGIFREAENYYYGENGQKKDIDRALKLYEKVLAADLGEDPKKMRGRAEYAIGVAYLNGLGSEGVNEKKGFSFIRRSVDSGYKRGVWILSYLYREGMGVSKNMTESLKWSRICADAGDEKCMRDLAGTYRYGEEGVGKDMAEALKWYEKAAQKGHAGAAYSAGQILYEGKDGVEKDHRRAVSYLKQAVEGGEDEAAYFLGMVFVLGEGVPVDDVRSQNIFCWGADSKKDFYLKSRLQEKCGLGYFAGIGGPRDYSKALMYLEKAAVAKDNPRKEAWISIGHIYGLGGYGVKRDDRKAVSYYNKAVQAGLAKGKSYLTKAYFFGLGVPQDKKYAYKLALEAANENDPTGMFYMAKFFSLGEVVEKNMETAAAWAERAAEAGSVDAMVWLGAFYFLDDKGMQDLARSFKWYEKAAEQGNAEAAYFAGVHLEIGKGTAPDETRAVIYFRQAAEGGIKQATKKLEKRGLPAPAVEQKEAVSMLDPDNWGDL